MQDIFATTLLDPACAPPPGLTAWNGSDPGRRFAVYRNNVVVSLVDALATRFPVVQRLVGEVFFRAMARLYVRHAPPRSRLLHEYGEGLPDFVETFGPARSVPYLADVARLEAARTRAYHAADATPLPPAAFAGISAERVGGLVVRLHPSVQLVASPWPIVSIWEAHRIMEAGREPGSAPPTLGSIDLGSAESALIARPDLGVVVRRLPAGGVAFLAALGRSLPLAAAAEAAANAEAAFDLAASLTLLVEAGIATNLHLESMSP